MSIKDHFLDKKAHADKSWDTALNEMLVTNDVNRLIQAMQQCDIADKALHDFEHREKDWESGKIEVDRSAPENIHAEQRRQFMIEMVKQLHHKKRL